MMMAIMTGLRFPTEIPWMKVIKIQEIVKHEIAPIVNQVDVRVIHFEKEFLKEAAKFVQDFKSLAKEADESLDMIKVLEKENERLLRAVKLDDENVSLEFQVLYLEIENEHRVESTTRSRRPQPRSNTKNDRKHMSSDCNNIKLVIRNDKSEVICATCKQCLITANHDVCVLNYVNAMNSCDKNQSANVSNNANQKKHKANVKKSKKLVTLSVIEICIWCVDSGCFKHMTGNLKLLINFVWKFMGTVRFGNDHVAAILGYGNLQWGNILITRVFQIQIYERSFYPSCEQGKSKKPPHKLKPVPNSKNRYVEQPESAERLAMWCRSDLGARYESCVYPYMGNGAIIGSGAGAGGNKLWSCVSIGVVDLAVVVQWWCARFCAWLDRHLRGRGWGRSWLPGVLEKLDSKASMGSGFHMDLCGPMRVESINGFLRSKDEAPKVIKTFLKKIQVLLQAPVIVNDREDIWKLGAKGDIGFFIAYSATSYAYKVYNRRTRKVMETMNVIFDELSAMAFEQCSLESELQGMTS
ncbi:hypothetical protein Tco_0332846 [Tanacetum coccineum]